MRSRQDRSWTLSIDTPELYPEQVSTLNALLQTQIYLVIGRNPIDEMPDDMGVALQQTKDAPSPSKRLRATMYRVRETLPKWRPSFEIYYQQQIEKVIDHFKEKIL
jgi:hypothetical protein